MKDRIFIAWSGSNDIGLKIKNVLETQQYKCTIGGNAENNSSYSSVGDTVIQQIKSCNQAIVIFQNKADGSVSNNLFFELGYVMAMYGPMKIHCVRRSGEQVVLPSDFDNSFVEPIDDGGSDERFVDGIIDYFMRRQKMTVSENKMILINNRYRIHDYIQSHFSDRGSKCSDYELAQYILFYMQASHMFNDEPAVYAEISKFKSEHQTYFSDELRIAVNVCLSFFEMVGSISVSDRGEAFLERAAFRKLRDAHKESLEEVESQGYGAFVDWCRVFISEHLTYCFNLYADNPSQSEENRRKYILKSRDWAEKTIEFLDILNNSAGIRENNDHRGLVSLFYAYVYRNMFIISRFLKDGNEIEWLKKTKKERTALKNNFQSGGLDSKLYNTFVMEYYLTLVEYLNYSEELGIDEDDKEDYLEEIHRYIETSKEQSNYARYIDIIQYMYDDVAGKDAPDD